MQRGLIRYRAGQARRAVVFARDGQAVKPGGPAVIQVSLKANFVTSRFLLIFRVSVGCPHGLARSVSSCPRCCRRSFLWPQCTDQCGEASSPGVGIEMGGMWGNPRFAGGENPEI